MECCAYINKVIGIGINNNSEIQITLLPCAGFGVERDGQKYLILTSQFEKSAQAVISARLISIEQSFVVSPSLYPCILMQAKIAKTKCRIVFGDDDFIVSQIDFL